MKQYNYEILCEARKIPHSNRPSTVGYLCRYDGDIHFVHTPDERYDDIYNTDFWSDIERHWCIDDYNPENNYYKTPDFKELNIEELR